MDGVTEAFVFDPWNPYRPVANDVVLDFVAGALTRRWLHGAQVDEPLAFESYTGTVVAGTGTAYDLHADRLGSIISVVDPATGTVAASATYASFGTRTQSGPVEQRYGFTAREHDTETGLIYYRARHYDPASGQFIQRDPIGFAGGDLNLYAYVGNDPYNWTDPSGLYSSSIEMRNLARGVAVGSMAAFAQATRACLANPACRVATNNAMQAGVGALADALEIGQPSGASPANGAAQGGLGGLFGAIVGLGQKIGQALEDLGNVLKSESEGGEGKGKGRDEEADNESDVQFGDPNDANKQHHIDRHLDGTGISRDDVEDAIKGHIEGARANGELQNKGDGYRGNVTVDGQEFEFRAHNIGGRINVGTIFPI
nr:MULTISPECIES: RHS repeat-associated core domain-containing protein [unclassified Yoonia]